MEKEKNVLGTELKSCSRDPLTGFFRDGHCRTCFEDQGIHTVCAQVDEEFLNFSASKGNDLSDPIPEAEFPGLVPGDFWCLCAARWIEAYKEGCAPKVDLESTHEETLAMVPLEILQKFATKAS